MDLNSALPLLIVLSALLPGLAIFMVPEANLKLRRMLNFGGNIVCIVLIALLIYGVFNGQDFELRLPLLPDINFVLHADALSLLFVSLSGLLWFVTTIYAIGYLEGTAHRSRFFGFFSLCVAATLGVALAGNMITFLIFYELLTLTTYPLVAHKGNPASLRAGRIYLAYTMVGGAVLLAGVVWLKAIAGPLDFTATGVLSAMPELNQDHLKIIFALLIAGLGVKAALVPFHGWLPVAMAAPAPVSALLHAVAVVKAGAFGIIRVTYDVFGIEFARDLGLTAVLAFVAAFTIVYGSVRAVFQDDIKKRLAYSTVSQVSYIALGTAIAGPIATIGGMVHLVHQGVMKITLFFCAGNLAETLGVHKVSELNGAGRRMPLTMIAFTVASLGMIGLPPMAGFVSKWFLGAGALEVGAYWVLGVLATSSLLNALYFLPILYVVWFKAPNEQWAKPTGKFESSWMLFLPPLITALLAIAAGLLANMMYSPLSWVELISAREYGKNAEPVLTSFTFALPSLGWVAILPLLIGLLLLIPKMPRACVHLVPLAALPALAAALFLPLKESIMPQVFFGGVMSLTPHSQVMLLMASLLWLLAGFYSNSYLANDKHLRRYSIYWLACMSGSFGLILSQDLFGFITFFTLMSFAAYGLVTHSGSEESRQAGKTYIQWVIVGELILFVALVGLAIASGGANESFVVTANQPSWVTWFLLVGFGIKTGLLFTHFWLPRAHPVAPVPASALLSGLMVNAGLLGWFRFLPLGSAAHVDGGMTLMALGLGAAFLAAIVGTFQQNPKTVLAYSTISQMGILSAGVGAGLVWPELWPVLSVAILFFAIHHGLAKAALFLSVGVAPVLGRSSVSKWLFGGLMSLPALALAGLPFTSGALAKAELKSAIANADVLYTLLGLTSIGTTLLMARFLDLLWQNDQNSDSSVSLLNGKVMTFIVLVMIVTGLIFWLPSFGVFADWTFAKVAIWSAIWPILCGLAVYLIARRRLSNLKPLPAGDLVVVVDWLGSKLREHVFAGALQLAQFVQKMHSGLQRSGTAFDGWRRRAPQVQALHPGLVFTVLILCLGLCVVLG